MEDDTLATIKEALQQHPVVVAYLFGSVAREDTTPLSDVDIGVYLDCDDYHEVEVALNADLPVLAEPNGIDLVVMNTASISMQHEIIRGDAIYCTDEERRIAIETRIMEAHLDMQPFHEQYAQKNLERIAQEGIV